MGTCNRPCAASRVLGSAGTCSLAGDGAPCLEIGGALQRVAPPRGGLEVELPRLGRGGGGKVEFAFNLRCLCANSRHKRQRGKQGATKAAKGTGGVLACHGIVGGRWSSRILVAIREILHKSPPAASKISQNIAVAPQRGPLLPLVRGWHEHRPPAGFISRRTCMKASRINGAREISPLIGIDAHKENSRPDQSCSIST